jgi:poly(hydroxyalkanoate) depolymerase family esterase
MPLLAAALGSWHGWPPNFGKDGRLVEVTGFGSNPGQLRMFTYVPRGLEPGRPLVLALHGCTQQANGYDDETGWTAMADRYRFALLLPQATINLARCFRWFDPAHSSRDRGEALSLRQMRDRMLGEHQLDPGRVYVTGLSAGGAMTSVLLAVYPDLFAGGAIVAGIPFRCAGNESEAQRDCGLFGRPLGPGRNRSAQEWAALVRAASQHPGPFPRVSLWHGTLDNMVHQQDQIALMQQWTAVHGIDQVADAEQIEGGHLRKVYRNDAGEALVETWLVSGLAHGVPVDPGEGAGKCGRAAPFVLTAGICASERIVQFWAIEK